MTSYIKNEGLVVGEVYRCLGTFDIYFFDEETDSMLHRNKFLYPESTFLVIESKRRDILVYTKFFDPEHGHVGDWIISRRFDRRDRPSKKVYFRNVRDEEVEEEKDEEV